MALASRLIASSSLGNLLRGSTRIMVNSRPLSSSVVSLDRRQRCILKATTAPVTIRCFSQWGPDPKPVDRKMVETRAMKVIGSYEKIDASKVCFMSPRRCRRWRGGGLETQTESGAVTSWHRFLSLTWLPLWSQSWILTDLVSLSFHPLSLFASWITESVYGANTKIWTPTSPDPWFHYWKGFPCPSTLW